MDRFVSTFTNKIDAKGAFRSRPHFGPFSSATAIPQAESMLPLA